LVASEMGGGVTPGDCRCGSVVHAIRSSLAIELELCGVVGVVVDQVDGSVRVLLEPDPDADAMTGGDRHGLLGIVEDKRQLAGSGRPVAAGRRIGRTDVSRTTDHDRRPGKYVSES